MNEFLAEIDNVMKGAKSTTRLTVDETVKMTLQKYFSTPDLYSDMKRVCNLFKVTEDGTVLRTKKDGTVIEISELNPLSRKAFEQEVRTDYVNNLENTRPHKPFESTRINDRLSKLHMFVQKTLKNYPLEFKVQFLEQLVEIFEEERGSLFFTDTIDTVCAQFARDVAAAEKEREEEDSKRPSRSPEEPDTEEEPCRLREDRQDLMAALSNRFLFDNTGLSWTNPHLRDPMYPRFAQRRFAAWEEEDGEGRSFGDPGIALLETHRQFEKRQLSQEDALEEFIDAAKQVVDELLEDKGRWQFFVDMCSDDLDRFRFDDEHDPLDLEIVNKEWESRGRALLHPITLRKYLISIQNYREVFRKMKIMTLTIETDMDKIYENALRGLIINGFRVFDYDEYVHFIDAAKLVRLKLDDQFISVLENIHKNRLKGGIRGKYGEHKMLQLMNPVVQASAINDSLMSAPGVQPTRERGKWSFESSEKNRRAIRFQVPIEDTRKTIRAKIKARWEPRNEIEQRDDDDEELREEQKIKQLIDTPLKQPKPEAPKPEEPKRTPGIEKLTKKIEELYVVDPEKCHAITGSGKQCNSIRVEGSFFCQRERHIIQEFEEVRVEERQEVPSRKEESDEKLKEIILWKPASRVDMFVESIWSSYDVDNDGALNGKELKAIIENFSGNRVSLERCKEFLDTIDADHDRKIGAQEFIDYLELGLSLNDEERTEYRARSKLHDALTNFILGIEKQIAIQGFCGSGMEKKRRASLSHAEKVAEDKKAKELEKLRSKMSPAERVKHDTQVLVEKRAAAERERLKERLERKARMEEQAKAAQLKIAADKKAQVEAAEAAGKAIIKEKAGELEVLLNKVWEQYDPNHTGTLDATSMKKLIEHFTDHEVTKSQCEKFVDHMDKDNSGTVDHAELALFISSGIHLSLSQRQEYAKRGSFQNTIIEFFNGVIKELEDSQQQAKTELEEKKRLARLQSKSPAGRNSIFQRAKRSKSAKELRREKKEAEDKARIVAEGEARVAKNAKELAVFLNTIFLELDKDHNDSLSEEEVMKLITRFTGHEVSKEQCKKVVAHLDKDGNGTIDRNELLLFISNGSYLSEKQRDTYAQKSLLHKIIIDVFDGVDLALREEKKAQKQARKAARQEKKMKIAEEARVAEEARLAEEARVAEKAKNSKKDREAKEAKKTTEEMKVVNEERVELIEKNMEFEEATASNATHSAIHTENFILEDSSKEKSLSSEKISTTQKLSEVDKLSQNHTKDTNSIGEEEEVPTATKDTSAEGPGQDVVVEPDKDVFEQPESESEEDEEGDSEAQKRLKEEFSTFLTFIWDDFDSDGIGYLDNVKVKRLMEHFTGHEVSASECAVFAKQVDFDGDGKVNKEELASFIAFGTQMSEEERKDYASRGKLQSTVIEFFNGIDSEREKYIKSVMNTVFHQFETFLASVMTEYRDDLTGELMAPGMKRLLESFTQHEVSEEDCKLFMTQLDKDGSGSINHVELAQFISYGLKMDHAQRTDYATRGPFQNTVIEFLYGVEREQETFKALHEA
jgi:Ca2+-binding EF-hand superfamily protein